MKRYINSADRVRYNAEKAFDGDPRARARYAEKLKDPTALSIYALDPDSDVRARVASNPRLPEDCMDALADDTIPVVRGSLAGNVNLPGRLFTKLSTDCSKLVRCCLGNNQKTPAEILAMLAHDDNVDVRETIAKNPNTPPDSLAALAHDPFWTVKYNLARNISTPENILIEYCNERPSPREYPQYNPLQDAAWYTLQLKRGKTHEEIHKMRESYKI